MILLSVPLPFPILKVAAENFLLLLLLLLVLFWSLACVVSPEVEKEDKREEMVDLL